jgi:hypothetical protein
MILNYVATVIFALLAIGCYAPRRECKAFKNGTFSFTTVINGETKTTKFIRDNDLEIDYYDGKADSSGIRWINDCEYIVRKLRPQNAAEEKAIHMKILSTTEDSYEFEYRLVGSPESSRGTAYKIK